MSDILSEEELEQVCQVRKDCELEIERLSCKDDDIIGDIRVCRFLRANGGAYKESLQMFKSFLNWRVESGIELARQAVIGLSLEEIQAWWAERANPLFPVWPCAGHSKEGDLLWYVFVGQLDAERFIQHRQIPVSEDLRCLHLMLEWTMWFIDGLSRKAGRMIGVIKLCDFEGLGSSGRKLPLLVPAFRQFMKELQATAGLYYCEHTKMYLALNTPRIFRMLFALLSKIGVTQRQLSRINVFGKSSDPQVQTRLLELIPADVLLTSYGGNLTVVPRVFPLATQDEIDKWYHAQDMADRKDADKKEHFSDCMDDTEKLQPSNP